MIRKRIFSMLILAFGIGLMVSSAHAQATRTWVSGVGDDANPCSRTAPCKTFAGAISKTAPGGEIDTLDPGGFGAVTITKSITLDGKGGGLSSILVAGTNGIVINAPGAVVILRNIQINGLGLPGSTSTAGLNGVNVLAAAAVHIEDVQIFGFSQLGINFTPSGGASAAILKVIDSTLTANAGGGILVAPNGQSAVATIFNTTANENKYGVRVQDNSKVTVHKSEMSSNTSNGFIAAPTSAPCELNIQDSIAANNGAYGVAANGAGTVRISGVGLYDNSTAGIGALGGAILSYGNNSNSNNASGSPTGNITAQ
jgi:hypothetical protein